MKYRPHERDATMFRAYGGTRDMHSGDAPADRLTAEEFDTLPARLCSRCGLTVLRARNETGVCSACRQRMRARGELEADGKRADRVEVGRRGWETRRKNAEARLAHS